MPSVEFTHAIEIEAPVAEIQALLCDLERLEPLHPLIESIRELPRDAAMPAARRYRVVDRIPIGPFRLRAVYTAALEPVAPGEVHGYAWQPPGIRLHTVYRLEATERGTRLVEHATVEAPWLLRAFVHRQARRAHAETLEKLKQLVESEAEAAARVG